MLIFLFGVGSVYVFYGYVTPYLEQVLGMGTVQASTTLMAYGVFCLISNILGGWIDARFGMRALLVTFVLQAAALFGLFAVGGTMPLALVFVFSLAMLMYLFSVSCITHFMDVARSRHPKSMVLASSVEPMAFNVGISFGTAVGGAVVSGRGWRRILARSLDTHASDDQAGTLGAQAGSTIFDAGIGVGSRQAQVQLSAAGVR